jgi:hypothetical protein
VRVPLKAGVTATAAVRLPARYITPATEKFLALLRQAPRRHAQGGNSGPKTAH